MAGRCLRCPLFRRSKGANGSEIRAFESDRDASGSVSGRCHSRVQQTRPGLWGVLPTGPRRPPRVSLWRSKSCGSWTWRPPVVSIRPTRSHARQSVVFGGTCPRSGDRSCRVHGFGECLPPVAGSGRGRPSRNNRPCHNRCTCIPRLRKTPRLPIQTNSDRPCRDPSDSVYSLSLRFQLVAVCAVRSEGFRWEGEPFRVRTRKEVVGQTAFSKGHRVFLKERLSPTSTVGRCHKTTPDGAEGGSSYVFVKGVTGVDNG